jgi:hypothetical protein
MGFEGASVQGQCSFCHEASVRGNCNGLEGSLELPRGNEAGEQSQPGWAFKGSKKQRWF